MVYRRVGPRDFVGTRQLANGCAVVNNTSLNPRSGTPPVNFLITAQLRYKMRPTLHPCQP